MQLIMFILINCNQHYIYANYPLLSIYKREIQRFPLLIQGNICRPIIRRRDLNFITYARRIQQTAQHNTSTVFSGE